MEFKHEIVITDADLPVRFFYSNDGRPSYVLPHFHDDIELMYLLSGSVTLKRNTLDTVLEPGDIAVINPNIVHSTLSENPDTTAYVMQISHDFLKKCQFKNKQIFFNLPDPSKEDLTSSEFEGLEKLKRNMSDFQEVFLGSDSYSPLKLYSIIYEIAYILFQTFSSEQENSIYSSQLKHLKRISTVTSYIKEHYNEPVSLSDIAELINITPAYLSRFFKNTLGTPFLEYITLVRLEHAYTDIITTDYPISYISDKNGFANYPLFNQKFKEKYGDTPLQMRKKVQVTH